MREILFRGKRTDNGEWVYGTPIPYPDGNVVMCRAFKRNHNVSSKTVGQFTGLTDRNGRKIFEGDILGGFLNEEYPEHETVVVVEWHENMWVTRQGEYLPDLLEQDVSDCFEVIGNIYDNPELLEVKQND